MIHELRLRGVCGKSLLNFIWILSYGSQSGLYSSFFLSLFTKNFRQRLGVQPVPAWRWILWFRSITITAQNLLFGNIRVQIKQQNNQDIFANLLCSFFKWITNNSSNTFHCTWPQGFMHFLGCSSYCRDSTTKIVSGSETRTFFKPRYTLKLAAGPWLLLISSSKCYIMEKFRSTYQCPTQAPKLAFLSSYNRLIHVTMCWFFSHEW